MVLSRRRLRAALTITSLVVGVLAHVLVAALSRVRCDYVGAILLLQIRVLVVHADLQLGVETATSSILGAGLVLACASLPVGRSSRRATHGGAQLVALDGALSTVGTDTRPLAIHRQLGLDDASIRAGSVVIYLHSVTACTSLLTARDTLEVDLLLVFAEDAVQELLELLLAVLVARLEGTAAVLVLRLTGGNATLRPWLPVQITGLIRIRIIINVGSLLILINERVEIDVDGLLARNGRRRVFHRIGRVVLLWRGQSRKDLALARLTAVLAVALVGCRRERAAHAIFACLRRLVRDAPVRQVFESLAAAILLRAHGRSVASLLASVFDLCDLANNFFLGCSLCLLLQILVLLVNEPLELALLQVTHEDLLLLRVVHLTELPQLVLLEYTEGAQIRAPLLAQVIHLLIILLLRQLVLLLHVLDL